ncbi:cytochrome P450 [Cubamyces sp. BRFM 1775]|nr:cytochrome P450 [Cubamyces sp. BRFM 1775]
MASNNSQHDHSDVSGAPTIFVVFCQLFLVFVVQRYLRKRWRKALPPGPSGLPLLGNVYDIPQNEPWVTYRDWTAKHGDVICVRLLGHPVIVLNSVTSVTDLLEKRSSIYSDRPTPIVSISRMLNWIWSLGFKPYDDDWRRTRRELRQYLQPSTVMQWHPVQARESRRFLQGLLHDQRDLHKTIQLSLCRTLLGVAYGLPADDVTTRYVDLLGEIDSGVSEAYDPTVLFIPWLRYLPSWFPGGSWKNGIEKWRLQATSALETPFKAALSAVTRGTATSSIMSELFEKMQSANKSGVDEELVKAVLGVVFVAGADTTAGLFFAFFCAMIIHPEVQKRAQETLDAVVGPDRLPEHADRSSLPYINAIVKEVLRWHSIAPFGLAHRCMEDNLNVCRGWVIPKDATVMANIWWVSSQGGDYMQSVPVRQLFASAILYRGILHDPERFPEPDAFRPERFLKDGKLDPDAFDPATIGFGFGRRICPGRDFAEDTLFINIASVLHAFDILPAVDEQGKPVPVEFGVTSGLVSTVKPFKYTIRPRSSVAEALVRDV